MRSDGRRRALATIAGTILVTGCFETPPTSDEQRSDGDDRGTENGSDGTDTDTAPGSNDTASVGTTNESDGSGTRSDTDDGGGGSFDADVRFKTERVRSEINTFDVSVRVDLKDSDSVRVSIGQVERRYTRSGIYDDVTRARLDTRLRAEAYTDGEWKVVERGRVPIENSDDFGFMTE